MARFFFFLPLATSLRINPRDTSSAMLSCYDYIIVGGGVSGLVVANRLSEDPAGMPLVADLGSHFLTNSVTVLVLESGPLYVFILF